MAFSCALTSNLLFRVTFCVLSVGLDLNSPISAPPNRILILMVILIKYNKAVTMERPLPKPQQLSEPLLYLNDHAIAIYPDSIIQYAKKDKNIASNLTLPTLNDLEQIDKVIEFSKNDIAFRID